MDFYTVKMPPSCDTPLSVCISCLQEGSLPKITLPIYCRDNMQDVDSDQESVRNMGSDNRRVQAKIRRHTLPPILPEPEL